MLNMTMITLHQKFRKKLKIFSRYC